PAHRPMVLAQLAGNRAAVYGLRIPLTPEEALNQALEQLLARLVDHPTEHATTDATPKDPQRPPATATLAPPAEGEWKPAGPVPAGLGPVPTAGSTTPKQSEQDHPGSPGDRNGTPTGSCTVFRKSGVGGFTRASEPVDNFATNPAKSSGGTPAHRQRTALRAGSDQGSGPDWATTVPTSKFAALIAADWLRRRLPVFASCSRRLVRHLCRPYWAAGWCNRDILHAMDHRPGVFGQVPGVLISPGRVAAPRVFIASRLTAWRDPDGAILPGHYSARLADVAAATAARARVGACHGRAGAALLRPGEHTLTAHRITEHGRTARPPASSTARATAKAAYAATRRRNTCNVT
ncbi:MAG: hypothetical protein ACREQ5_31515, partial [Candidatus Dormibacteria bacterium]